MDDFKSTPPGSCIGYHGLQGEVCLHGIFGVPYYDSRMMHYEHRYVIYVYEVFMNIFKIDG